ncbi:MAG: glycosyl hydrolase [Candidatus Micrarchaeota archaeon]
MKNLALFSVGLLLIFLVSAGCFGDNPNNNHMNNQTIQNNQTQIVQNTTNITMSNITINYSIRFGVGGYIYPDKYSTDTELYAATKEVDKLGYVWLRHPGGGIAWYEIQPTKSSWDFSKLDAVINNNKHPWIIPVYGMVGNVYPFGGFSTDYLRSLTNKPDVMQYITSHTTNLSDSQQKIDAELFVKTLVSRYKDQIDYWEIGGNEGLPAPEKFDIIYNTYPWIKEIDPDSKVLLTANCGDGDWAFYDNINALDTILSKGAQNSFDIANFHYYGYLNGDFEERLEERYDEYKAILDKHDIDKPIWVTETSTCSSNSSQISPGGTEERQAKDVVKRLAIFSAKGAEKVFWYSYGDHTPNDLFYGCSLMSWTGPKPAYYTFKLVVDKIGFFKTATKLQGDNVWLFEFVNQDNKKVFIGWAKTPETIDMSNYTTSDKVFITHIIEDRINTEPEIEIVQTNNLELTDSPIFIEVK